MQWSFLTARATFPELTNEFMDSQGFVLGVGYLQIIPSESLLLCSLVVQKSRYQEFFLRHLTGRSFRQDRMEGTHMCCGEEWGAKDADIKLGCAAQPRAVGSLEAPTVATPLPLPLMLTFGARDQ